MQIEYTNFLRLYVKPPKSMAILFGTALFFVIHLYQFTFLILLAVSFYFYSCILELCIKSGNS